MRSGPQGLAKVLGWYTTGRHAAAALRRLNVAPDVLYSYWGNAATVGLAVWKTKVPSCRAVCRVHRYDVYSELHDPPFFPFREACFPQLDQVHCVSRDAVRVLSQDVPDANVCYSPLGVERGSGRPKLPGSKVVVCSCSAVVAVKRVDLIARSVCRFAAEQCREVVWIHFGDGPYLEDVRRLATDECPGNLTVELRGRIRNADIRSFYADNAVSVFVNLSASEGVPVSMMEAISEGIPILATNVGGVSDIVNRATGVLLPKTPSPADAAEGMARVVHEFDSLERRQAVVEQFRKHWDAETNFEAFARKLCNE